ncbi:WD40 repeat protein [Ceratobasidium sp. AG-Ba]|nr:WD40 repeat protein [Ceratobasidium sp. AG-Ba]
MADPSSSALNRTANVSPGTYPAGSKLCQELFDATKLATGWEPFDWQLNVAEALCKRRDVLRIAGTGSGNPIPVNATTSYLGLRSDILAGKYRVTITSREQLLEYNKLCRILRGFLPDEPADGFNVYHAMQSTIAKELVAEQFKNGQIPILICTEALTMGKVFTVAFSPDDPLTIAAAGSKAKLQVWDIGANAGARKSFGVRLPQRQGGWERARESGGVVGVHDDDDDESDQGE